VRLELPEAPTRYVPSRMNLHGFQALPVQVYKLPLHHADPFDRQLIAQSQIESMPLISVNAEVRKYEVEVVW